ncbi:MULTISPECIES: heme ABC transporter ATP-binding protein [Thermoactinomyces]|jgi:iron complex transport system ATP-binding protein|uniref:Heme ABC transporter ATP-binding protein n=1 Tax=Thermoactinomyces daqus TaxID=1329516 RepID=A0A7W1X9V1_9BACL|nr:MULTISPECIES: heme ABC transporter ATP-binding protein [Thermoactinomyces]MBA4542792.1 heme ABC transporter ATP-binding protein [Thermoactinomyces daqus]MBH8598535.1 heme ABC transporter ATP-binding protein [Thermoactinomyces sp. CICC 10523]MBH8604621.1 heme ABC transporter ATP-binding protein [Thermoactinomyces sp. CICC 10522]MBH8606919.1 heme ABC transporter ATP-binding protein [Thermoactinomyces sp. CICC 10521]
MLQAARLGKKAGGRWLLQEIDLCVEKGEMVGVLGANGSGKSTLIRCLTGEWKADSGEVRLKGERIDTYSPKERARIVAVLAQEPLGEIEFTVEEVVKMGRYPYQSRWSWASGRDFDVCDSVLRQTGLWPMKQRQLAELSGGERQRVAIARTMAQEPELLVLDEPTTFLDIRHQLAILDLLKKWQSECGLTILIVLHDLNLAAQYCDRLVLLKEGRMVTSGVPKAVITRERIEEAYGVTPLLMTHPTLHVPQVFLQPAKEEKK